MLVSRNTRNTSIPGRRKIKRQKQLFAAGPTRLLVAAAAGVVLLLLLIIKFKFHSSIVPADLCISNRARSWNAGSDFS